MIKQLYNWTIRLAEHPNALWALAVVAFVESSVFPIPPDALMIPMIIAQPSRAFLIAGVALLASVTGGMLGYFIGWGFFESIGRPVLEFYGKTGRFETFAESYNAYGAWAVLIAGVTPFPYKVITILSGLTGLNIWIFLVSSIIARGFRFFLVAVLLWKFGTPIRDFIEQRLGLMFTLFVLLIAAGFYAVRYL